MRLVASICSLILALAAIPASAQWTDLAAGTPLEGGGGSAVDGHSSKQEERDGSDHVSCHRVFISEPKRGKAEAIHIWIIPNNT